MLKKNENPNICGTLRVKYVLSVCVIYRRYHEFYLYAQKELIGRLKKLRFVVKKMQTSAIKFINQIEVFAYRHLLNILIIVLSFHIVNKTFYKFSLIFFFQNKNSGYDLSL